MSASHGPVPWRQLHVRVTLGHPGAHTGHISNSSLHPLPSQSPFTLWCLFVRRVPGHWKKRVPAHLELETTPGLDLNLFGGKCCTKLPFSLGTLHQEAGRSGLPPSGQLELAERGFGQYLTLGEFRAGLLGGPCGHEADKEQAPQPAVGRCRGCRSKR